MREAIAAWRSAVAELLQRSGMVGKAVADVVQAQRMGQMGIGHGHHVSCCIEQADSARLLTGKVFYDSVRYPACNLDENGHCMLCQCPMVVCGSLPLRWSCHRFLNCTARIREGCAKTTDEKCPAVCRNISLWL